MTTNTKPLTIAAVRDELRAVGIVITKTEWDDFRVNYRGGPERTAYYTGDLEDARDTGLAMMRDHMAALAAGGIG